MPAVPQPPPALPSRGRCQLSLADALGQGGLPADARLPLRARLLQALALAVDGDLGGLEGRAGRQGLAGTGRSSGDGSSPRPARDGSGFPSLTSFRAPSSSASRGGMTMERLGGFLLCRRLLPEWLPPFLSPADILGRQWLAGWDDARRQPERKQYLPRSLCVGKGWVPAPAEGLLSGISPASAPSATGRTAQTLPPSRCALESLQPFATFEWAGGLPSPTCS